jgi:hypothetical protein
MDTKQTCKFNFTNYICEQSAGIKNVGVMRDTSFASA